MISLTIIPKIITAVANLEEIKSRFIIYPNPTTAELNQIVIADYFHAS